MYQSVLRNELSRRLGVEWNTVHNHVADIAGIPRRVVKHFSKRRTEIEAELDRLGLDGPDAARDAMLATRTLNERMASTGTPTRPTLSL
jgi:conjugative relaxase-like TrwC/TraI family protein